MPIVRHRTLIYSLPCSIMCTSPPVCCRSQDPATALALFEKLWTGEDSTYCMRARIDMKSLNGCLRDPVMFRFNADPHHITGTK
jgi:glutamyl/glutaminyl-tRNA synthetase